MTAMVPAWTGSLTTRSATEVTEPTMLSVMTGMPVAWSSRTACGDLATHDRPGEDQDVGAWQVRHGAHGGGDVLLAHERDGVHRDALAPEVVTVGLGDRAQAHLGDLRPAADDDHPLAEDLAQGRPRLGGRHARCIPDRGRGGLAVEVPELDVHDPVHARLATGRRERVDRHHVRARSPESEQQLHEVGIRARPGG